MDVLTFIATLIDSLVWPIIIIVFVVLLRKPLSDLIPFLERLRYKDFELQFKSNLQLAKDTEVLIAKHEGEIPERLEGVRWMDLSRPFITIL